MSLEFLIFRPLLILAIAIVLLGALKLWLDRATPYQDDSEIVEHGNLAIALQRAGIYLAMVIALSGAIRGTETTIEAELGTFIIDGIVTLVTLILCSKINDLLILQHDRNCMELKAGNRAIGIVEAGAYIATGSVLAGAFTGEGGGIESAIVFAALGQFALVGLYLLQRYRTPYSLSGELKKGNVACALTVAGELVALGTILRASISGPSISWAEDLKGFSLSLISGLIFLWITRLLVDLLFLPKTTIREQVEKGNLAVGALVAGLSAGASLAVAAAL